MGQLYSCGAQSLSKRRSFQNFSDVVLQRLFGDRMNVEIDVLGIANAFPEKPKVAASLEGVQLLIQARAKLCQENKMESLHCLNIFRFRVHAMIIRIIDTSVEFEYLLHRMDDPR